MTATETYGPFDTLPWADQTQWYRFAPAWAPSGVIDAVAASASAGGFGITFSGLTPTLAVGRAWVRGAGYEISGGAKTLAAVPANANATLSRRDRIVLRRDLAAKTVAPVLIQGTPSGTPSAPALTQVETGQWDEFLFSFLVPPASGTTITGITDEREFVDPDGRGRAFAVGGGNITTDASGNFSVTHNLGSVPSAVFVQPRNVNANGGAVYAITAVTSTTFSGRRFYNNLPDTSNTLSAYWRVDA